MRNSERINASKNFSAVMPLYFKKPIAANGTAPNMHSHDTVSVPRQSFKPKYAYRYAHGKQREDELPRVQPEEHTLGVAA